MSEAACWAIEEFAAPTTGFVIDQACGSTQH
jgi:hypothetical protein